jgi:hypothetical protein
MKYTEYFSFLDSPRKTASIVSKLRKGRRVGFCSATAILSCNRVKFLEPISGYTGCQGKAGVSRRVLEDGFVACLLGAIPAKFFALLDSNMCCA